VPRHHRPNCNIDDWAVPRAADSASAPSGVLAAPCYHYGDKNSGTTRVKIGNRPKRTTGELIALIISAERIGGPPISDSRLTDLRHDWTAVVIHKRATQWKSGAEFSSSVAQVVTELRLRNAWLGTRRSSPRRCNRRRAKTQGANTSGPLALNRAYLDHKLMDFPMILLRKALLSRTLAILRAIRRKVSRDLDK